MNKHFLVKTLELIFCQFNAGGFFSVKMQEVKIRYNGNFSKNFINHFNSIFDVDQNSVKHFVTKIHKRIEI